MEAEARILFRSYMNACESYDERLDRTNSLILLFCSYPQLVNKSIRFLGFPIFSLITIINLWQWKRNGYTYNDRQDHLKLMYELLEVLLEHGLNVNIRGSDGMIPLACAHDKHVVKRLLDCGANVYGTCYDMNVVWLRALDINNEVITVIAQYPFDHRRLIFNINETTTLAEYYVQMCVGRNKKPNRRVLGYLTTGVWPDNV